MNVRTTSVRMPTAFTTGMPMRPSSDFLTALNIWDRVFQADGEPSNSALRRICKTEYFSWLRIRQWKDLVTQLRQMCKELKFKVGDPMPASRPRLGDPSAAVESAGRAFAVLCVGCGWHPQVDARRIAVDDGHAGGARAQGLRFRWADGRRAPRAMKRAQKQSKNDYQGARGTRFALFPASAVAKKTPQWVMSTELVETSRLWARYSAQIDPAWAEPLAGR